MRLIVFMLLLATTAQSATWYVDDANDGGTENGTSWATAWGQPIDVNWALVSAGDTIKVSSGSYTSLFLYGASGTFDNPITIKKAEDVGHTGIAYMPGFANVNGKDNVTFDGSLSSSFIAPTNILQVEFGATCITNNCGFVATNSEVGFYNNNACSGVKIKWCAMYSITNHPTDLNQSAGFSFPIGDGAVETNCVIEYCHIDLTGGDAVQWTGGSAATRYDEKIIRFCWFRNFGDDGIQGGGLTVTDCIIGPSKQLSGHADQAQTTGEYITLKNTKWVQGGLNSFWRIQAGGGAVKERFAHYRFHNNLFICEQFTSQGYPTPANPIEFVNYNPQVLETNHIWDDVVFANNTAWGWTNNASVFFLWSMSFGSGGGNMTNTWITNSLFANNVVMDCNKGMSLGWVSDRDFPPYGQHYASNDLIFNFNTVAGTNAALTDPGKVSYLGVYTNGEALAPWPNNISTPVKFTGLPTNFELLPSDTGALNNGTNLSAFFNEDILHRPRNISGAWDRGAFELQETNLVVFLTFDADSFGGNALDSSGNSRDGKRFNLTEYSYPSNRVASAVAGTTFRPNLNGNAADFLWRTNDGVYNPTYGDDGAFFAVTNAFNALSNMSEMTVMCWARYQNNNRTDVASPGYEKEANAQLICGGGTANGTAGSWFLGRYNLSININETRFVVHTNPGAFAGSWGSEGDRAFGRSGQVIFNYFDRGFEQNGNTTNWYHYAVTFSSGLIKTYFNGIAIGTNDISANVTKLRLGGSGQRGYDWLGVGVNTHVGTPQFDNESGTDYPNNGWFNGALDQVRIYNRALAWQEVVDVANSEGAQFANAPEVGSSPQNSSTLSGNAVLSGNIKLQ